MSSAQVYTGFWTNWSRGQLYGATLTLSPTDSQIFTAFLAAFVGITGTQFWRILCYALHQVRATKRATDGLHQQHQINFRNSADPVGAVWSFTQQGFYWRKHVSRSLLRSLPWVLMAAAYITAFTALAILGPPLISTSMGTNRLLVQSDQCGSLPVLAQYPIPVNSVQYQSTALNESYAAITYANTCYDVADTSAVTECSIFQQPRLEWTSTTDAPCPFGESSTGADYCLMGPNTAFQMDTGLLDSNRDFGINSPSDERIQFRVQTTCTPLNYQDFSNTSLASEHPDLGFPSSDHVLFFYYGPLNVNEYTQKATDYASFFFDRDVHTTQPLTYVVDTLRARANTTDVDFFPDSGMKRTDADIALFFIEFNTIRFRFKSNDPVFGAHTPVNEDGVTNPIVYYKPDHLVSPLGCVTQYQVCDPSTSACTPMVGMYEIQTAADTNLTLSTTQQAALLRLVAPLNQTGDLGTKILELGATALDAQTNVDVYNAHQIGPLPDNQWQIEVSKWFGIFMASIQSNVYSFAAGAPGYTMDYYNSQLPADVAQAMCGQQLTQRTDGTLSFSVLGTVLILVLGVIVVILNMSLQTCVLQARRRFRHGSVWKTMRWVLDDRFQLHRLAYRNAVTWRGTEDVVPTTVEGELFGAWDEEAGEPVLGKLYDSEGSSLLKREAAQRQDAAQ